MFFLKNSIFDILNSATAPVILAAQLMKSLRDSEYVKPNVALRLQWRHTGMPDIFPSGYLGGSPLE